MIAADLAAARVQLLQRKIADVEKRSRRALTNEAYLHDMHQLQRLSMVDTDLPAPPGSRGGAEK